VTRRTAVVLVAATVAAAAAALVVLAGGDDGTAAAPRPPVVEVIAPHGLGSDVATGFAIAPGRVVTVAHVLGALRAGASVAVRAPGGARLAATVLARDDRDDVALLAAPGLRAPRGRTTTGRGEVTVLVTRDGRVRGLGATVRRAITARFSGVLGGPVRTRPALELAADVRQGDSGAPVLTPDGRIAGVLFARSRRRAATAYAVDASAVERLQRAAG
jgi:hypothetical protein